ncbi:MAG: nucleotidyltransferase family protein [Limnospira sp.]
MAPDKPDRSQILVTLRELKPMLREKYGVTRLGIFGSVARNQATESSDVDIVIETERPNLFRMVHLKEELETALNKPVDLIRYRNRMNSHLKHRIEKEAVYV